LTGAAVLLAAAWIVVVWLGNGVSLAIGHQRISSSGLVRPGLLLAATVVLHLLIAGVPGVRAEIAWWRARVRPGVIAASLSLAIAIVGLSQNAFVVGGADAFSYVSQAELWRHGLPIVPMPIAAEAPWPDAAATFAPFGYRPAPGGAAIVPVTAPGLSLILAAFGLLGHRAMFWVVPLAGGLLVWTTFLMGRRLGSSAMGAAAAWMVATSPAVLAMIVSPMSDVPTALFWALATLGVLGDSRRAAVGAGLAASMAILIRPNLAPVAAVLALWLLARRWKASRDLTSVALFVAAVVPGCLGVALVNRALYGSPFASGYGNLGGIFSAANIATNLARYGRWLVASQTPLALAGLIALALPIRRLWRSRDAERASWLLAGLVVVTVATYLAYRPFDDWWYLRFLLPCWPPMCLGAAIVLRQLFDDGRGWMRAIGAVVLVGVGVYGIQYARSHGAFPSGEGDARYGAIANLVRDATPQSAVVVTSQHAGPTWYYSGRRTLLFDALDPAWLDRALDWLAAHGHRPFILLEDWERPLFERRFAGQTRVNLAELAPVAVYQPYSSNETAYLFDPFRPDGPTIRRTGGRVEN
jgi:hypothetical protein